MSIRKWKKETIKKFGRDNIKFLIEFYNDKKIWTFWLNPNYKFKEKDNG